MWEADMWEVGDKLGGTQAGLYMSPGPADLVHDGIDIPVAGATTTWVLNPRAKSHLTRRPGGNLQEPSTPQTGQ